MPRTQAGLPRAGVVIPGISSCARTVTALHGIASVSVRCSGVAAARAVKESDVVSGVVTGDPPQFVVVLLLRGGLMRRIGSILALICLRLRRGNGGIVGLAVVRRVAVRIMGHLWQRDIRASGALDLRLNRIPLMDSIETEPERRSVARPGRGQRTTRAVQERTQGRGGRRRQTS